VRAYHSGTALQCRGDLPEMCGRAPRNQPTRNDGWASGRSTEIAMFLPGFLAQLAEHVAVERDPLGSQLRDLTEV